VSGFLHTIAALVTSFERKLYDSDAVTEYELAKHAIEYSLVETMWDALTDYTLGEPVGNELEVRLRGTPERYYEIEADERAKRLRARGDQAVRRSA
jgi:hypothetical protein